MNRRTKKTVNQEKTLQADTLMNNTQTNETAASDNSQINENKEEVKALEAQALAIEEQAKALFEEEKKHKEKKTLSTKAVSDEKPDDKTADSAMKEDRTEEADEAAAVQAAAKAATVQAAAEDNLNMNKNRIEAKKPAAAQDSQTVSLTRRIYALYAAFVLVIGAASYGAYYLNEHKYDSIKDFEDKIASTAVQVDKTYLKIQDVYADIAHKESRIDDLLHENAELKGINNVLKSSLLELTAQVATSIKNQDRINNRLNIYESRNPNDWLIAKSYFLVSNAQNLLETTDNLKGVIFNLSNAQLMLVNIEDPKVIKVRDAIFNDMQVIKSIQPVDVRGIAFKIDSILNNTDNMPLNEFLESNIKKDAFNKNSEVTEDVHDWKQNLLTSLKTFSSRFIEIRRRDEAIVNQFLSPEQTGILLKNIKTQLLLSKVALYQQDNEAFSHNINEVINSINNYYDLKNATVLANLESLYDLLHMDIVLDKPDALRSYELISAIAKEKFSLYEAQKAKEDVQKEIEADSKAKNTPAGDKKKKPAKEKVS